MNIEMKDVNDIYKELENIKNALIDLSVSKNDIEELTKTLKKELKKNEQLNKQLKEISEDLSSLERIQDNYSNDNYNLRKQIEVLKEHQRILYAEKSMLLRKIKLEACDCIKKDLSGEI